jgi:hypothetical protein
VCRHKMIKSNAKWWSLEMIMVMMVMTKR